MKKTIEDYHYKGSIYAFEVEYRVLEGAEEPGDWDTPTFYGPDQLAGVNITNLEVYNPDTDGWDPADNTEEIENSLTLDDL